ncbi:MAG: hypothetical protein ACHQQS_10745 [Thermoanaerobaculales bacterium]
METISVPASGLTTVVQAQPARRELVRLIVGAGIAGRDDSGSSRCESNNQAWGSAAAASLDLVPPAMHPGI